MSPLIWLIIGVLLLAGEALSMALFLLYGGVAALLTAGAAALGLTGWFQLVLFLVLSYLLIALVRPRTLQLLARRHPTGLLTNLGHLVNKVGVVTATVTDADGTIRLGASEYWTARPAIPGERLEVGEQVRVHYVDGLTLRVARMSEAADVLNTTDAHSADESVKE